MARNPVGNHKAFGGAPSPWARNLAAVVASEWVDVGARTVFVSEIALTGRQVIVVPKIGRCQLEAIIFYGPKLGGDNLGRLVCADNWGHLDCLLPDWRQLGRAFVHFRINPSKHDPLEVLDHNGSVRIVNELVALDRPYLPTLGEFDEALGCSLVEARADCSRLFQLHGYEPLPKLPDIHDNLSVIARPVQL